MKNAVLIPAYNEEKNILEVIKGIKKLKKINKIIVVDDGSKDRTYEIAKKSGVTVIKHKVNKGKGEAIKTGLNYIKKINSIKKIIIMDADLQYRPKEVLKIIKKLEKFYFVIGCRDFSKVPFRHRLGNFIWKITFNILFRTNLKDTNCGFMGLSKDIIDKIEVGGGYIIENCITASVIESRIEIGHVPVSVIYKKKSGIRRGIRVFLGVLYFIIKRGINHNIKRMFG